MKIHFFNPENDLALADGNANYCPPPAARAIAYDLASLPLWYAMPGDSVVLPDALHALYRSGMATVFDVAREYTGGAGRCVPWGWSKQVCRRLAAMGFHADALMPAEAVEQVRYLSNRKNVIDVLQYLSAAGLDVPELPAFYSDPADVARFINSMPRSVVKAPWSGSGKGIAWGIGRVEVPVEHFYKGVIRRQGGVLCERFYNKAVDFAMEFCANDAGVSFAGYSLFTCEGGSYSGNILATDTDIERFLAGYVPVEELRKVRAALEACLTRMLAPVGYCGYLGVDMLVYSDGGGYRLHPCIEVNLRMNMGAVARLFYDRFVVTGRCGRFEVPFYRQEGEALRVHDALRAKYPLLVEKGRVKSGYLSLAPVTASSRYSAYVLVGDDASPAALYTGVVG